MSDDSRKMRNARAQRAFRARLRDKHKEQERQLESAKEDLQRANDELQRAKEEIARLTSVTQLASSGVSASSPPLQGQQKLQLQRRQLEDAAGGNISPREQMARGWSMATLDSVESVSMSENDPFTQHTAMPGTNWAAGNPSRVIEEPDAMSFGIVGNDDPVEAWPFLPPDEVAHIIPQAESYAAGGHADQENEGVTGSHSDGQTSHPAQLRQSSVARPSFSAQPWWLGTGDGLEKTMGGADADRSFSGGADADRNSSGGAALTFLDSNVDLSLPPNVFKDGPLTTTIASETATGGLDLLGANQTISQYLPTNHLQASIFAAHHLLAYVSRQVTSQSGANYGYLLA